MEIDLKNLIIYTKLPEIWKIFNTVISLGSITESGFSLMGTQDFLRDMPIDLDVTYDEFWRAMSYFLLRLNREVLKNMETRRSKNG